MNRYALTGLMRDARNGARVALFAPKRASLRAAFDAMSEQCNDASRITRSNGRERIDFPNGGRLTFHCVTAGGGRGVSVDIAYVDEWQAMTEDARADVAAAAARGELIRA